MAHSGLATNPYALSALVCAATFVVAPITLTVYKYAAFLTLITFMSLILCQYKCASVELHINMFNSALASVQEHSVNFCQTAGCTSFPCQACSCAMYADSAHLPVSVCQISLLRLAAMQLQNVYTRLEQDRLMGSSKGAGLIMVPLLVGNATMRTT